MNIWWETSVKSFLNVASSLVNKVIVNLFSKWRLLQKAYMQKKKEKEKKKQSKLLYHLQIRKRMEFTCTQKYWLYWIYVSI